MAEAPGYIYGINGPVIKVRGSYAFAIQEMVCVGHERLIGEVIGIHENETIIQVYEDTAGLMVGDPVEGCSAPLCATLAPGILSHIFDGIQRPLSDMTASGGPFIGRGIALSPLDEKKLWPVHLLVHEGDIVSGGQVIAETPETALITHRVMVPPSVSGQVIHAVSDGDYTISTPLLIVKMPDGKEVSVTMKQLWPIKHGRPVIKRLPPSKPLITGQRIMDSLFPLAKGGAAAIPGGFGTGKTMNQHQIAKWCDADIILYIGCGERGNEMTQVLNEFSALIDPKSHRPLLDRTVLIANTSNMPVAAREASIYTGITLAEYYRDMGYHVALMADSTSRWAEALREISGRLEEMPAEEGFPSYLASRLAAFYERAGLVTTLGGAEGSVSIIGAVSPQGGDFSEPVTQNTKRFIRCFWALDKSLAYARHYPAIDWLSSYSSYADDLSLWYNEHTAPDFLAMRTELLAILGQEAKLMEIVKLIGADVLPDSQKATLEIARVIRLGFLQQNAFHKDDTYVPLSKQYAMMSMILFAKKQLDILIEHTIPLSIFSKTGLLDELIRMKYTIGNDDLSAIETLKGKLSSAVSDIVSSYQA